MVELPRHNVMMAGLPGPRCETKVHGLTDIKQRRGIEWNRQNRTRGFAVPTIVDKNTQLDSAILNPNSARRRTSPTGEQIHLSQGLASHLIRPEFIPRNDVYSLVTIVVINEQIVFKGNLVVVN